jgi:hypothetical protein
MGEGLARNEKKPPSKYSPNKQKPAPPQVQMSNTTSPTLEKLTYNIHLVTLLRKQNMIV